MAVMEHKSDDFSSLLAALCDGTIEADDFARLERRLENDPAARHRYIAYLDLHGELCWDNHKHAGIRAKTAAVAEENIAPLDNLSLPVIKVDELGAASQQNASLFGSLGGWALPYIVATVTIVAMLLGAWVYKINRYQQIATNDAPSNVQFKSQFAGRITGMKDCVWANGTPGTIIGAAVPFDRKFALSSGLLEVTYSSGPKVILEGPCEYTADSAAGGYLAVGKLTARVEKKVASVKPQAAYPQSLTLNPQSLFSVRTPTAVVTDLGTEFGVEVEQSGATMSYVFQGRVEFSIHGEIKKDSAVRLSEGESARVETGLKQIISIPRQDAKPESFVRNIKKKPPFDASLKYAFKEIKIGGGDNRAVGINNADRVVGFSQNSIGNQNAFVFDANYSSSRTLPGLGGLRSFARDINDAGQIIGYSSDAGNSKIICACVWNNREIIRLDQTGKYITSEAWGINNAGAVAGTGKTDRGTTHSFIYTAKTGMVEIGGLGGTSSNTTAINDAGQVVGWSTLADDIDEHAYLFSDGKMTDLGAGGGVSSRAYAINNHGAVVGYYSTVPGMKGAQAFIYDSNSANPSMRRLHSLGAFSLAFDVNDDGQVVGRYWNGIDMIDNYRAFVYANGKMHNLNELADLPNGYVLRQARGISNAGQIAAWGTNESGRRFACLLTPIVTADLPVQKGGDRMP